MAFRTTGYSLHLTTGTSFHRYTMSREELFKKYASERTPTLTYTRCMGYIRPVAAFNSGKVSEYRERVFFTEDIAMKKAGC